MVPPGTGNRQLVVGEHVGALLRLGPARSHHHRNLGDAELPGGEYPGVARDQATISPTSTGVVQPHSLTLAAMAAIWASVWVRAFFAYGRDDGRLRHSRSEHCARARRLEADLAQALRYRARHGCHQGQLKGRRLSVLRNLRRHRQTGIQRRARPRHGRDLLDEDARRLERNQHPQTHRCGER